MSLERPRTGPRPDSVADEQFQLHKQGVLKAVESLRAEMAASWERRQARRAKDPLWQALYADPEWVALDQQFREIASRYAGLRAKFRGRLEEELSEAERAESDSLRASEHVESFPLRERSLALQKRYRVTDPIGTLHDLRTSGVLNRWQSLQITLELIGRELDKGAGASIPEIAELVEEAQATFPGRMEEHLPCGILDGGGPMTTAAMAQCVKIKTLLGGLARKCRSGVLASDRIAAIDEVCDWIEGTLRPVHAHHWTAVRLAPVESDANQTSPPSPADEPADLDPATRLCWRLEAVRARAGDLRATVSRALAAARGVHVHGEEAGQKLVQALTKDRWAYLSAIDDAEAALDPILPLIDPGNPVFKNRITVDLRAALKSLRAWELVAERAIDPGWSAVGDAGEFPERALESTEAIAEQIGAGGWAAAVRPASGTPGGALEASWKDPISNADLARATGYADENYLANLIREALSASGAAVPVARSGQPVLWSHAQLRRAAPHLAAGKLWRALELSGLVNPE